MEDLFNILPEAITYLASGFAFIAGFYFLIDRRFDFFSEISFSVMLVLGFVCTNLLQAFPAPFVIENAYFRNIAIFLISGFIGFLVALIRNTLGQQASKFVIKTGRRKTSSSSFWYDLLDDKDKPIWLRLIDQEHGHILQGVLLSLDEAQDNPYLLLGYCTKFNLEGDILDNQHANDKRYQCVVRADAFQEIIFIYDEKSDKPIELSVSEEYDGTDF